MPSAIRFVLVAVLISCCSCTDGAREAPDTLITTGYDQAEMAAATARARNEIESFIDSLTKGAGSDFGVKAPIEDKGQTEHFWLTDVTFQNGEFSGKIGNDPGIVSNVKFGQDWKIKKGEISDWMFMRDGKMHGNYTMRPLLKGMPKEEADAYRAMLAQP